MLDVRLAFKSPHRDRSGPSQPGSAMQVTQKPNRLTLVVRARPDNFSRHSVPAQDDPSQTTDKPNTNHPHLVFAVQIVNTLTLSVLKGSLELFLNSQPGPLLALPLHFVLTFPKYVEHGPYCLATGSW